jgi:hypothetical protein|tara:strand:+ start:122 stop:667 length:546 start_codon:yes stop_codon:yes gene_type:complete
MKIIKSIPTILLITIVFLAYQLITQNKDLKKRTIDYKNQIEELYKEVDSLKFEIIELEGLVELSKYTLNKDDILSAIMYVESRNDNLAYAPGEDAAGCLQIRKCMVDDVNRILKRRKSEIRFTYEDRWNREKSIQMFNIFCTYYKLETAEEMARGWNGGPRGMNNPATAEYWQKVEAELTS